MKCPQCGSADITPSHRRGFEEVLRYVYPRAPYRCKECWGRFWVFENPYKTWTSKLLALATVVILVLLIVWLGNLLRPSGQEVAEGEASDPTLEETIRRMEEQVARSDSGKAAETPPSEPASKPLPTPDTSPDTGPLETPDQAVEEPVSPPPDRQTGETDTESAPAKAPESEEPVIVAVEDGEEESVSAADKEPVDLAGPDAAPPVEGETPPSQPSASPEKPTPPAEVSPLVTPPSETEPAEAGEKAAAEKETAESEKVPLKQRGDRYGNKRAAVQKKGSAQKAAKKAKTASGPAQELKAVRARDLNGKFAAVLESGSTIQRYKYFYLSKPPRLVLHLKGSWDSKAPHQLTVQSELVRRIRIGEHKNHLTVVMDLKSRQGLSHSFQETEQGLILTLSKKEAPKG